MRISVNMTDMDETVKGLEVLAITLDRLHEGTLPLVYSDTIGACLLMEVDRYGGKCLDALSFEDRDRDESCEALIDYIRQGGVVSFLTYEQWVREQAGGIRWCSDLTPDLGKVYTCHYWGDCRGQLHTTGENFLGILQDPTYEWED